MMLSRAGANFARFYSLVRDDLFAYARAMNFSPTDQQAIVMKAVQDAHTATVRDPASRYIAVKSGQGPGKTAVACLIGGWRALRTFLALGVVTAPTMRQCKEVWLAEFRSQMKKAHPDVAKFFEVRATEVEILGVEDWGIKLASASQPDNMAGWHNPALFFIVDEASGVMRQIIETIMGTLTNVDKLLLLIGNPTARDSAFFDCFNRDRKRWTCFTLNAEESPIVDKNNILRMADLYGRHSDVFRVRVLGEFPLQDPNCVMNSDDLEFCAGNHLDAAGRARRMLLCSQASREKAFGIDFARYGDDSSVIYRRSGLAIVEQRLFTKQEPDIVIASSFMMQKRAGWTNEETTYVADADGMGQGAMHHFYNSGKRLHEFHFGGVAGDSSIYHDRISEALFGMAEDSKNRALYIPNDPELISELSTRQYHMTLKGKIKVESKEEYKKRVQTGSPDRADAAAMVFYKRAVERARVARLGSN